MRLIFATAALLSAINCAAASGGLWCDVEDKAVRIAISSGVTRGMGGPIFNFAGKLEVLDNSVTEDLRKTEFDGARVAQYWLDNEEIRLLLYREREGDKPHGYVELTILTQAGDDEGMYGGSYKLKVFDGTDESLPEGKSWDFNGKISCGAE
jgi:hypothetical protein